MVLGIVTLVLALLTMFCTAGSEGINKDYRDGLKFHRQIGAYYLLYGGILAAVGGALNMFLSGPRGEKAPKEPKAPKEKKKKKSKDEPAEDVPSEGSVPEAPAE